MVLTASHALSRSSVRPGPLEPSATPKRRGWGCDRGADRPTPSGFDFGEDSTGEAPSSPQQAAGVSAEIRARATQGMGRALSIGV